MPAVPPAAPNSIIDDLTTRFARVMDEFAAGGAWPGAVAVSGGGDLLALMHLLARWAKKGNGHRARRADRRSWLAPGSEEGSAERCAQGEAAGTGSQCAALDRPASQKRHRGGARVQRATV